ncbi:hypothetical protein BGZ65_007258 [Modicella reniformis]|uniref:LIM zinc-binding domain-containing protein n=1 Tax=Modicella reniformis TaxID=1440133 RepID=A0A9P6LXG9_9FUNG|nr:hypothetical protein BGZ65_007258 [Modicella reniformis]
MSTTPPTAHLDHAVKNLSLSSVQSTLNPRAPSPVLESMGETGPNEPILESMGPDGYEPGDPMHQQYLHQSQFYGTVHGPGYGSGHLQQAWSGGPVYGQQPGGYGSQPASSHYYHNYYDHQQQHHPVHLSQEQYLMLQQQHYQQQYPQQPEHLRQQHVLQAVAHGYHASSAPSTLLQHPEVSPTQQSGTATTSSKTITPRIVPIVDIPKYTVVNPPKSEIASNDDEQDDDWAPEPPPRDIPRKDDPKPSTKPWPLTPTEAIQSPITSIPKVDTPTKQAATVLPSSPLSKPTNQPTTPVMDENSMPSEDDREPLPPPREFRRKTPVSPTPTTAAMSTASTNSVSGGVFRVGSPFRPTTSPTTSSSTAAQTTRIGSPKKPGIPTPGSVRTNSAKFNAMVATNKESTVKPNSVSPKISTSTISPADVTSSVTANPWTTRKAVDIPERTSISKGINDTTSDRSTPKSNKSLYMCSDTASSDSMPATNHSAVNVNKELPPIRPETPQSSSNTPEVLKNDQLRIQVDLERDSKCIVTEEDKLTGIPMASDTSKEVLVEQEKPAPPVVDKPASPAKPVRRNSSGAGSSHQNRFICASCDEPITGVMITAMGKSWHSDHFACCVCNVNLEHIQFIQKDGQPYCHLDYHDTFSPKCGYCNTAIENECLTALGKSWHPGHFFCRECGDPFDEDGFLVHDDHPYCEKDYLRLFAPKCSGCEDPIQGDFISALKGKWHRDCFGCTVCHIGFDSASYYVDNGKPYCKTHYKSGAQSVAV